MSIGYRVGLLDASGLTPDELFAVMKATGVTCVVDRIDGAFLDFMLHDGVSRELESDPGSVPSLERLFACGGSVTSTLGSAAELCVLIPGDLSPEFRIARKIPEAPGWFFKSLSVALAEVEAHTTETGENAAAVLATMRRAEELTVGMIFGERLRV